MFESVRALLEGAIDYAGLFPPAGLDLAAAAANYRRYLDGADSWMLGRFVAPASRLPELEAAITAAPRGRPWRVATLAGPDLMAAVSGILAFNAHARDAAIDSVELKAETPAAVRSAVAALPSGFTVYFEIPLEPDPAEILAAIAIAGHRAKIRTGGIRPDAFPSPAVIARFIARCDEAKVPFKATAGLHHPLRGNYALTYASDSPRAMMHGFLNVLLAATFRRAGLPEDAMRFLLEEPDPPLQWAPARVAWRGHSAGVEQILRGREQLIISFGSCSFEEPAAELRRMRLL